MSASLRKRPNCCVAAKRRYVPLAVISRLAVASFSPSDRRPVEQGSNRDFQTDRAGRVFCRPSSKLLTKSALHLVESLLACGLVTGGIGLTRASHGLLHSLNGLRRYFAHPFRNGSHRALRRLSHPDHGARRSRRAGGNYCCELVVDLCLHAVDVIRTWAGVTRR